MNKFFDQLSQALQWVADLLARLSIRRDRAPLDTVDRLFQFVSTRSALIAQKKLYGYLKERTGLRYTSVMEDEVFVHSVDIAKMEVFAACLSDMTVFAVAHIGAQAAIPGEERRAIALACYTNGIRDNEDQAPDKASIDRWIGGFRERAQDVHWDNIAARDESLHRQSEGTCFVGADRGRTQEI